MFDVQGSPSSSMARPKLGLVLICDVNDLNAVLSANAIVAIMPPSGGNSANH